MSRTLSRSIRTRSHQALLDQSMGRSMPSLTGHTQSVIPQPTPTVPTSVGQLVDPPSYCTPNFTRGPTPFPGLARTPGSSIFEFNPHISPFLSSAGSSNSTSFSNLSSGTTSDGIQSFPSSPLKRPAPVPDSPAADMTKNNELPPRFEDEYNEGDVNNNNGKWSFYQDGSINSLYSTFVIYSDCILLLSSIQKLTTTMNCHLDLKMNTTITPTTLAPESPDEERKYQVHFNLWQPECPPEPEPKKQKRTAGGSRLSQRKSTKPKYKNYAPKVPTYITYSPKTADFDTVKKQLFDSCNEHLPGVSRVLENSWVAGGLAIIGFVTGSNGFKGQDKASIKKPTFFDDSFDRFNTASLKASAGTKMGFRISHENPLASENARRSLASALKDSRFEEESEASDGEEGTR
ncbi:uncharacterized protein MELLADRAFT_62745 [Melampsora larici-populina 98AG31]|uniref:Uncharacterized protein n=1 Tax=Melampsora larici-populina (strain 98AG31 / pathotype 3-4-7) TaxID=747676 RepID=F4RK28_MELLP|nr:uncharacterized protein MELLADRAFT_62745 [Melampsora larici-populina 98AG31]EGG07259.1 hypothetical protein MELLADRAFT_62745 [Melampsora larici-populina 98AG31]